MREHIPSFRTVAVVVLAVLVCSPVQAQIADTIWETEAASSLSFVRSGFHNWQEGGISSFAITAGFLVGARRSGRHKHSLRIGFGMVRQDSLGLRKAEDIIDLQTAIFYKGARVLSRFQPTFASRLRTQFAKGFHYGQQRPTHVSSFLAPATLQQSVGFTYGSERELTLRLGAAAKETVVVIPRLRPRYGVSRDRHVRIESGLEILTEYSGTPVENVDVVARLQLFAAVNQGELPDALLETLVTMRVNKWLQVNAEYVAMYDADVRYTVQMREVIAFGVAVSLM